MEKGNAVPTTGAAATSTTDAGPVANPTAGPLVNLGPAIAAGAGANVNATAPRPRGGSITNPDGSTRTWERNAEGVTTITDRDADGNVTRSEVSRVEDDGTRTTEVYDSDGRLADRTDKVASASTPNARGGIDERWTTADGDVIMDEYDADGNLVGSKWNGPNGNGTLTTQPDGTQIEEYTDGKGNSGRDVYGSDGELRSTSGSGPDGDFEATYEDNGDYSESWSKDGIEYSASRTTAPDGTITETSSSPDFLGGGETVSSTTTTNPDGTFSSTVTDGDGKTLESTTGRNLPDGTSQSTTTAADGSTTTETKNKAGWATERVTKYPDGRTATYSNPDGKFFGGETTWTNAAGETIDPYKIDFNFDLGGD